MSRVWTVEEIHSCPEFGDIGWFYGLVRGDDERLPRLREIFPGAGYGAAWPLWNPVWLWHATKDVWFTPRIKGAYVGARSPEQQAADLLRHEEEMKDTVPWEEIKRRLEERA